MKTLQKLRLAAALVVLPWLVACPGNGGSAGAPATSSARVAPRTTAELMTSLHHFHDKLGYALEAGNQPLAAFYLAKVEETLTAAEDLAPLEGLPVSSMIPAMMSSSIQVITPQIAQGELAKATETYRGMTMACNSCHAATRREYIVIQPASGKAPFNQQFAP